MIWGITLEPGQAHTEVIEDEVHLSMATMESRGCIGSKADNFSHVVIKTGTTEYLLCTLVNGITYQQCLDLKLMPSDKVTFSVQGTNVVYLTGYSFASSETDQEITQTEDWIEDPVLEEGIPQDSVEYSEGDSSFQPPVGHDVIQGQQQNTADEEDQEQFSLQYEVPATEQQYQYTPERGHQQITQGAPSSSHQRQLQQHPSHDTGESNLDIKEEIHTVVDTDEDVPTDQANEGISSQSIHQPSTSAGVIHLSVTSENDGSYTEAFGLSNSADDKQCFGDRSKSNDSQDQHFLQQEDSLPQSKGRSYALSKIGSPYQRGSGRSAREQTWGGQRKNIGTGSSYVGTLAGIRNAGDRGSYICIYCGKCFRDVVRKEEHEIKHQCRYCKKTFNIPRQREQHELIHTGERPYKCSFCFRGFRDAGSKVQHERIHTGEKPYKCRYCGMCFTHRESKRRHERTHAPD